MRRQWIFMIGLCTFLFILFSPRKIAASETTLRDPFFDLQWGLRNEGGVEGSFKGIDIGIEEAWAKFGEGKREVIVAVLDTGVDIDHEDFEGAFWVNENEIPDNGVDDDGNGFIDDINGWNFFNNTGKLYDNEYDVHSTHVTGIIAANRNGIGISGIVGSSKVKIMALKVMGGKEESGYTKAIGDAIRYAEQNGASICNLSFGTVKSDRNLTDAIENSKMLFITAAGNGNRFGQGYNIDLSPVYPASYDFQNLITVANLKPNGYINGSSNYGARSVQIAAPGTKIYSTVDWTSFRNKGYIVPYTYMSGTSMAVPMVTGVAAMLYSNYPELSLLDVREAILQGSVKLNTLQRMVETGGMLNAAKAMTYCEEVILPRLKEEKQKKQSEVITSQNDSQVEEDKGTAPKILLKKGKNSKHYIIFQDEDNDISRVRYFIGRRSLSDFEKGKRGRKLKMVGKKIGLSMKKGKTYTFYVLDKKGNEAIRSFRRK